jgi:hypothetical protein
LINYSISINLIDVTWLCMCVCGVWCVACAGQGQSETGNIIVLNTCFDQKLTTLMCFNTKGLKK